MRLHCATLGVDLPTHRTRGPIKDDPFARTCFGGHGCRGPVCIFGPDDRRFRREPLPDVCRRDHRLRDLHAGRPRDDQQLETWGRASRGTWRKSCSGATSRGSTQKRIAPLNGRRAPCALRQMRGGARRLAGPKGRRAVLGSCGDRPDQGRVRSAGRLRQDHSGPDRT